MTLVIQVIDIEALERAILTEVLLANAQYDHTTQWLTGFDPEAAGMILAG